MANIIGDVSLTNKTGVFLGSVNLSNLNADANDIVYSPNGFDLSGLALSDGLSSNGSQLSTVGNPNIQLTSNSLYVNDNVNSIQSAVDSVSQADTIFISSGSFGEQVLINDKYNISLISPTCNNATICEILNGVSITGTSELIRLSNLQIKGNCEIKGVGRHNCNNLNVSGSAGTPITFTIGQLSTKYIAFTDCGFNQYVTINVSAQFASVVYFINCNFGNCTINLNNVSPLQVIFSNCAGFNLLPSNLLSTTVGMNVLNDGSEAYCSTSRLLGIKSMLLQDGTNTLDSTNAALTTNGISGFKLVNIPDSYLRFIDAYGQNYAGTGSGNPLVLFTKLSQANLVPNKQAIFQFTFNFNLSGGDDVVTFDLLDDGNVTTLASLNFSVSGGNNTISSAFYFTLPADYTLNYSVRATALTHTLSYDTNMSYSLILNQYP